MQTIEKKLMPRRIFLQALGLAAVSLVVGSVAPLTPMEFSIYNKDPNNGTERSGVFVQGEKVRFESGGKTYTASLNEIAILDTLKVVSAGQEQQVQAFLQKFPLRVALHTSSPTGYASYCDSARAKHPEIEISTNLIKDYCSALQSQNSDQIRNIESGFIHELWHLRQDATSEIIRMGNGVQMAILTFIPAFLTQLSYNMNKFISERRGETDRAAFFRQLRGITIQGTLGIIMGGQLGYYLSPSESQAAVKQYELVDHPEIRKHAGTFIKFVEQS